MEERKPPPLKLGFDDGSDIEGMTTNERLSRFGLLGRFDAAATARNRSAMIDILGRAMVDNPDRIADTILTSPETYGF